MEASIVFYQMPEEMLEIINDEGATIGLRPRSEIHGNPSLLHKVIHVLVFNDKGELLLQKRSLNKDVAPGKWDTSVGGHVSPGEDLLTAALREMEEELGVIPDNNKYLYSYRYENAYESEIVHTYRCIHNGPFPFNKEEIDAVAFWSTDEIRKTVGTRLLSDNFEVEFRNYNELLPGKAI
jgi:isopentenyldiphosphate isomerase